MKQKVSLTILAGDKATGILFECPTGAVWQAFRDPRVSVRPPGP